MWFAATDGVTEVPPAADAAHQFGIREVEREWRGSVRQREGQGDEAGDRGSGLGGNREMQPIAQVADATRPILRQGERNAG